MDIISTPSSLTWRQNFRPHVNGERVRWDDLALNLLAGDVCKLELEYEDSWLVGEHILMEYQPGEEGQEFVFDPPLGQLVEMAEGTTSLSWTIKTTGAPSGSFVLQFAIPEIVELSKSPPVPGAILNLAQELEVKFDEFPVSFGARAYPCHGAKHTFMVLPKPGSRLLNKNIKLLMGGENLGVVVRPSLANEQLLTPEGVAWELNCLSTTENGSFSLQLMLVEFGVRSSSLAMTLGHNWVTAKRWTTGPHTQFPKEKYYYYYVLAESVFLNAPAPGVPVSINNAPSPKFTDYKGEVRSKQFEGQSASFSIYNLYNGSRV